MNVEKELELLETLRFEINAFLSMALKFSLIIEGTPDSNGKFWVISFVSLILIDFSTLQFNLKYCCVFSELKW